MCKWSDHWSHYHKSKTYWTRLSLKRSVTWPLCDNMPLTFSWRENKNWQDKIWLDIFIISLILYSPLLGFSVRNAFYYFSGTLLWHLSSQLFSILHFCISCFSFSHRIQWRHVKYYISLISDCSFSLSASHCTLNLTFRIVPSLPSLLSEMNIVFSLFVKFVK